MKILSAAQIKALDQFTIENKPISSLDLMERASQKATEVILPLIEGKAVSIFCGPGNNGGDGLAIARLLNAQNIEVSAYYLKSENYSSDFEANLKRVNATCLDNIPSEDHFANGIILDALFGIGLTRQLDGFAKELVLFLNKQKAIRIAIDSPSGLFADIENEPQDVVFKADYTFTFHQLKKSFLFAENYPFTGEVKVIDIGLLENNRSVDSAFETITPAILSLLKPRGKFDHKGTFGHGLIIGGSYGKVGAIRLAAEAALRSGIGLLTAFIPKCAYVIMQSTVPECMTISSETIGNISQLPEINGYNAIGIGPGLGTSVEALESLAILLISTQSPLVIDADALNLLSQNPHLLVHIPEDSIITPHPKEFDRLAGESKTSSERLDKAIAFSKEHNIIVILKGGYTAICLPNGKVYINTIGNPGMATGGSGDVLTGVLVGLLAQGYSPELTAKLGVYHHALAGDKASQAKGQSALLASDIIKELRIE